jgi:hypothetical protein
MHVTDGAKLYLAAMLALAPGCGRAPAADGESTAVTTPIYDKATGRLERLESDQDGDGTIDAVAFMEGVHIKHVEIDRDRNGTPDRWEYYVPNPTGEPGPGSPDGRNLLDRAEERAGPDRPVTRREVYVGGVISRVEEDSDADGRVDKWEFYTAGELSRVELDLQGKGFPDRRLVYGAAGVSVEQDPDGDGVFVPVPPGGGSEGPGRAAGSGSASDV